MAVSIPHFVCLEVGYPVQTLPWFRPVATGWHGAMVAVVRMETIIYVSVKTFGTMKPRTRANENAA